MPERIGLYGGSFDPIHLGHLILARDALERLDLARLIFLPAAISPHKLHRAPGASGEDRLALLHAAVADEPRFSVDPCELGRAGPSYTVDTLHALRARFYLIGEDNVPALGTWRRADELLTLAQFVVCRRHAPPASPLLPTSAFPLPTSDLPVLERWIDISSTEIRNRVAAGRSIRYLVPPGVETLISARQLYRPTA